MEACARGTWHLVWGDASKPEEWKPCPWFCGSWRHDGPCARYRSQLDYSRLMVALGRHPLEHMVWGVLTLTPEERREKPLHEQYKGLERKWYQLAREVRRRWGKFEYHWSLEQHANGSPHANIIIVSEAIAEQLREHPPTEADVRANKRAPHWWRNLTAGAGFGFQVSLEHVASREGAASYCTKVEKGPVASPSALGGEMVKLSQLPTSAPKRTRRIRSSKGFLPPLRKNPELSGRLVRTPMPSQMAVEADAGMRATLEHVGIPAPPQSTLPAGHEKMRADQLQRAGFSWAHWARGPRWKEREAQRRAAAALREIPTVRTDTLDQRERQSYARYERDAFRHAASEGEPVWLRVLDGLRRLPTEIGQRAQDNAETAERFDHFQETVEEDWGRAAALASPEERSAVPLRSVPTLLELDADRRGAWYVLWSTRQEGATA